MGTGRLCIKQDGNIAGNRRLLWLDQFSFILLINKFVGLRQQKLTETTGVSMLLPPLSAFHYLLEAPDLPRAWAWFSMTARFHGVFTMTSSGAPTAFIRLLTVSALLAAGLLGCKDEPKPAPPPKPVVQQKAEPLVTREEAMATLLALPEVKT